MDPQVAARKASALIAQATDDSVTPEEARSHALLAAKLIAKHDLRVVPEGTDVGSVVGAVASPEVADAVGAVVDLVGRVTRSGAMDSLKRVVSASKRAAEASGARRRRHRR